MASLTPTGCADGRAAAAHAGACPATLMDSPLMQAVFALHPQMMGAVPVVGAGNRIGATTGTGHCKGLGITCIEYGPGFIPIWPVVDERIQTAQVVTATKTSTLVAEIFLV